MDQKLSFYDNFIGDTVNDKQKLSFHDNFSILREIQVPFSVKNVVGKVVGLDGPEIIVRR